MRGVKRPAPGSTAAAAEQGSASAGDDDGAAAIDPAAEYNLVHDISISKVLLAQAGSSDPAGEDTEWVCPDPILAFADAPFDARLARSAPDPPCATVLRNSLCGVACTVYLQLLLPGTWVGRWCWRAACMFCWRCSSCRCGLACVCAKAQPLRALLSVAASSAQHQASRPRLRSRRPAGRWRWPGLTQSWWPRLALARPSATYCRSLMPSWWGARPRSAEPSPCPCPAAARHASCSRSLLQSENAIPLLGRAMGRADTEAAGGGGPQDWREAGQQAPLPAGAGAGSNTRACGAGAKSPPSPPQRFPTSSGE